MVAVFHQVEQYCDTFILINFVNDNDDDNNNNNDIDAKYEDFYLILYLLSPNYLLSLCTLQHVA